MARSKIGGAFGMLRGSIGSVTYSTKKTNSGKTEQIARQKAQSVTNPNTTAQIMQRMKLGPAQRFFDAFEQVVAKGIISHSFEAIPYGNASRTHFISLAMKEEAAVYVPKGVDFFVPGEYVVSEGSLTPISYFNQLTDEEAAQNNLIVNFNDKPLTAENIETFPEKINGRIIRRRVEVTGKDHRSKGFFFQKFDNGLQLFDSACIIALKFSLIGKVSADHIKWCRRTDFDDQGRARFDVFRNRQDQ